MRIISSERRARNAVARRRSREAAVQKAVPAARMTCVRGSDQRVRRVVGEVSTKKKHTHGGRLEKKGKLRTKDICEGTARAAVDKLQRARARQDGGEQCGSLCKDA